MSLPVHPRTVASAFRTAFYGGIAAFFSIGQDQAAELVNAIIIGAVLADFLTWSMRSLALLPNHLLHGCYDSCINLFFGWYLYTKAPPEAALQGSGMVVAFLAFMIVLGIKVLVYGVQYAENLLEDDE